MPAPRQEAWQNLSDRDLLKVRICDLGVRIKGSEIEPRIAQLMHELEDRGLRLRPVCYLSDEWQCPDGEFSIAIPFFLSHPRLKALEFRMTFEVEGGTAAWCMRLLRHEAGHALDHVYGLSKRRDFRRVFGSPSLPYDPYFYTADPHSKRHVRNVPHNYAQCHPVEDFAETFAVWVNPYSQWKTRYKGWPAMRKLRYVERVARKLADVEPIVKTGEVDVTPDDIGVTVEQFYEQAAQEQQARIDIALDAHLGQIFLTRRRKEAKPAADIVRKYTPELIEKITYWTGVQRPIVRGLIDYPLERPCLFTINVGEEPWSVWDVCCAFAEQYARIYEQPERYGVWGHDLSDLWIERLLYFPEKKLIYPHMGS